MTKIKILILSTAAVFFLGIGIVPAHAQLVVNQYNLNNNGSFCYAYGSNIIGANSPTDDAAPFIIAPDGKIYAVTGNYNVTVDCSDMAEDAACEDLQAAVSRVETTEQIIPNFPQVTTAPSNNSVTYVIGHFGGEVGFAYEKSELIAQSDHNLETGNIQGIRATIYLDEDWDGSQSPPSFQTFMANQNFLTTVIAHETSHAFGLADAYNGPKGRVPGTMGTLEGFDILANPNLPPYFWDPAAIAVIQAINQGTTITIAAGMTCVNECALTTPGGVPTFVSITNPNGTISYDPDGCAPPSNNFATSSAEVTGFSYCTCGGTNPSCVNVATGQDMSATQYQCPAPQSSGPSACVSVNPLCPYQPAEQGTIQADGTCSQSMVACGAVQGNPGDDCYSATNRFCPSQPANQGYVLPDGTCSAPAITCTQEYSLACSGPINPQCPDTPGTSGYILSDGSCSQTGLPLCPCSGPINPQCPDVPPLSGYTVDGSCTQTSPPLCSPGEDQ